MRSEAQSAQQRAARREERRDARREARGGLHFCFDDVIGPPVCFFDDVELEYPRRTLLSFIFLA